MKVYCEESPGYKSSKATWYSFKANNRHGNQGSKEGRIGCLSTQYIVNFSSSCKSQFFFFCARRLTSLWVSSWRFRYQLNRPLRSNNKYSMAYSFMSQEIPLPRRSNESKLEEAKTILGKDSLGPFRLSIFC